MKIIIELEPNEILGNINAFSVFLSHFGNENEVLPKTNTNILKKEENDVIKPIPLRIDEVEKLEEFQKKIWLSLTEKQQKSLNRFVEYYKKKILEDDFKIKDFNKVWQGWISREKNI